MNLALVLVAVLGRAMAAYPPPPPTFDAKSYTTWAPLNIHVRSKMILFFPSKFSSHHPLIPVLLARLYL